MQTYLGNLASTVAELEEQERQKSVLKDWIKDQEAVVNEWRLRPAKLRADASAQELNTMNDLFTSIGQKRAQLLTDFPENDAEVATIEGQLDNLEDDLTTVLAKKQASQDLIGRYRQSVQGINTWFDNLVKRIDVIDKGSGLTCTQKQAAVSEIQTEFDEQGPGRVEEVKQLAAQVTEAVNNLDSQQVEEQVRRTSFHNP